MCRFWWCRHDATAETGGVCADSQEARPASGHRRRLVRARSAGDGRRRQTAGAFHGAASEGTQQVQAFAGTLTVDAAVYFPDTTSVPGRISSVPRAATSSPAWRSPNTSISAPDVRPVVTSTHSARASLIRTTNLRSVVLATLEAG